MVSVEVGIVFCSILATVLTFNIAVVFFVNCTQTFCGKLLYAWVNHRSI